MSAIAFFRPLGGRRFEATEHARGPWSNDHLHASTFVNADLSVHVHAEPVDGWVGMQARTWIDGSGAGVAHSALWSTEGPLGHSLQSLVVRPAR